MPGMVVTHSAGQGGPRRPSAATHFPRKQRPRRSAGHRRGRQDRRWADKCRGKPHVTGFHTVWMVYESQDGTLPWDGKAEITVREAQDAERSEWRKSRDEAPAGEEDGSDANGLLVYLMP